MYATHELLERVHRQPSTRARRRRWIAVLTVLTLALCGVWYAGRGDRPAELAALTWPSSGTAALSADGRFAPGSPGSGDPVPIASVAKVMTAYVVLHDHPL
ncbi:MAG: hypothetical protein QOF39_2152, partial [Frankiales bacterium]|nr:hypothetical protein [Frankiales bacterium]